jgi:hypothetical protein
MSNSLRCCRIGLALIVCLAIPLQSVFLVGISAAILVASVLLGVDKAPLVILWRWTAGRRWPGTWQMVDRRALRFAHGFGSVLNLLALAFLLAGLNLAGWIVMGLLALAKVSAAFGFCSAAKLYDCLNQGNSCCRVGGKLRGNGHAC